MLEYASTALDKDFMTLWSKYLLTGSMDQTRLTALAELGQVNAVQSYYLFTDAKQKNQTIDGIVDLYSPNDLNQQLAILNRRHRNLVGELDQLDVNVGATEIFKYQRLYHQNVMDLVTMFERTHNILYLCRANEVAINDDYLKDSAKKRLQAITDKELGKLWKKMKTYTTNIYETDGTVTTVEGYHSTYGLMGKPCTIIEHQPPLALQFAVAKHNTYFVKNDYFHQGDKKLGRALLFNIAKRNYSKELNTRVAELQASQPKLSRCTLNGDAQISKGVLDNLQLTNSGLEK